MLRNQFLLTVLATASFGLCRTAGQCPGDPYMGLRHRHDANPCSRTAPCKTFAGAISKTAAGGEIDALDPGGFGALTITKAITIDGGGGQVASVLASGTNGIVVSAGAGQTVTLRNLRINGIAGTPLGGLNGVQFLSGGALHIENCTIFGFTQNGININLNSVPAVGVFVTDTVVTNSAGGIAAHNAGAGRVFVSMQRVTLAQKQRLRAKSGWRRSRIDSSPMCSNSFIAGKWNGVSSVGGTGGAGVQVTRSSIVNNATGAESTGASAFILFSNTLISATSRAFHRSLAEISSLIKITALMETLPQGAFTSTIFRSRAVYTCVAFECQFVIAHCRSGSSAKIIGCS